MRRLNVLVLSVWLCLCVRCFSLLLFCIQLLMFNSFWIDMCFQKEFMLPCSQVCVCIFVICIYGVCVCVCVTLLESHSVNSLISLARRVLKL